MPAFASHRRAAIWSPGARAYIARRRSRWSEGVEGVLHFVRDVVSFDLVPDQIDMLLAIARTRLEGKRYGPTVTAGHHTGKTFADSVAALWWLHAFDLSYTVITAPKERQIFDNIWPEMQRIIMANRFLAMWTSYQKTRIGIQGELDKWQIVGRTAVRGENIAGAHAANKLVIVDEASGVGDEIFEPLLAAVARGNVIIQTGNPTRNSGEFYRSHHRDRNLWFPLRLDARRSPLVTPEQIRRLEARYGPTSPIVAIRIDGKFPPQSEKAVFSIAWIEDARRRDPFDGYDKEEVCMGVDVAYFGSDSSSIAVRQGPNLLELDRWAGFDTTESAGKVISRANHWRSLGHRVGLINVDVIGYGAGVYDTLCHEQDSGNAALAGVDIMPVNVAKSARNKQDFDIMRDEMWFELSDRFRQGAIAYTSSVDADLRDMLESELAPVEYDFAKNGKRKVWSKDKMREVIGHSPDVADATIMAFYDSGGGGFVGSF